MSKYSNTPETELVSFLIEHYQTEADDESGYFDRVETIEPEAHYDYYGNRGAADLYVETISEYNGKEYSEGHLFEVKSERAIKEANGAGDIIRQFNKMVRYFFQDQTRDHPGDIFYELTFIPTPKTVEHVKRNRHLYQQIDDVENDKKVLFRTPEGRNAPGIPFVDRFDTVEESLSFSNMGECARAAEIDPDIIDSVRSKFDE